MEKPDRDNTQARAAERELKTFLQDYPDSPLKDEAAQKLRDVQEVLAAANLRVANQYMLSRRYAAAIRRVKWTIQDYPDYSHMDDALWVLGQSLERMKQIPAAGYYYGKIASEYPSSPLAESAKKRLEELNLPIPEPSPGSHRSLKIRPGKREKTILLREGRWIDEQETGCFQCSKG